MRAAAGRTRAEHPQCASQEGEICTCGRAKLSKWDWAEYPTAFPCVRSVCVCVRECFPHEKGKHLILDDAPQGQVLSLLNKAI